MKKVTKENEMLCERHRLMSHFESESLDSRNDIVVGAAYEATFYAYMTAALNCVMLANDFDDEGNEMQRYQIEKLLRAMLEDTGRQI